MLRNRQRKQYK